MKKIHIIAIVMIFGAIALLTTAADDMGVYGTFKDARDSGKVMKVVGQLSKDKEMYYKPIEDPNFFSFYITDAEGEERKVILHDEKPQDFELSEQVVITGSFKGDDFVAKDMLLKCPSKYKNEEIFIKAEG